MKKLSVASVILVVLLVFMVGCAPTILEGRKIDGTKVKQIVPGKTDVAQVEAAFGKPDKIENLSSGEDNYIYQYRVAAPHWWTIGQTGNQRLDVSIKDGKVQTYKFREEGQEAFLKD
jgi:hypothetical protein